MEVATQELRVSHMRVGLRVEVSLTFKELSDKGLVERYARMKGTTPEVLWETCHLTDEIRLTEAEAKDLGIIKESLKLMYSYTILACQKNNEFYLRLKTNLGPKDSVLLLKSKKPIRMRVISAIKTSLEAVSKREGLSLTVDIVTEAGCIRQQEIGESIPNSIEFTSQC